jgi:hypothetical protein
MTKREKEVYAALLTKNGLDHQLEVACGELCELGAELSRYKRNRGSIRKIWDELADVEVVLDQLKRIFDPTNEYVPFYKKFKIDRAKLEALKGVNK